MPDNSRVVSAQTIEQLRQFDTCTISNAIEQFDIRTRNEGFIHKAVHCIFPEMPPCVGYAVTATIRSSMTPVSGRCYYDRPDWWSYVASMPEPRFIVIEDTDTTPGFGALFGEIHANICRALNCCAFLTDGAIRDVPGIRASGLQAFAGCLSVSHAYAHIVEFGQPVEIGGLRISPGDLLHGDRHGVLSIPPNIAADVPQVARELVEAEKRFIDFCRSPEFSLDHLRQKLNRMSERYGLHERQIRT